MSDRFEFAHAAGKNPFSLIFAEGTFETLPFEIRLFAPWTGRYFGRICDLKPAQRWELSRLGYTILRETLDVAPSTPCDSPVADTDRGLPFRRAA